VRRYSNDRHMLSAVFFFSSKPLCPPQPARSNAPLLPAALRFSPFLSINSYLVFSYSFRARMNPTSAPAPGACESLDLAFQPAPVAAVHFCRTDTA
jgi:hypothetical protein